MKKYTLFKSLLLLSLYGLAQSPQFTWMSGYKITNQPSLYSQKGVTTATCMPGPRTNGVSWADTSGNLWMFGGSGNDAGNIYGIVSDLWKYNTSTNQWTWVKGDSIVGKYSSYGTQGVASNANKPAFRDRSAAWTHKNGDLYMFGGLGRDNAHNTGTLNDLWKYNITLNQWTWVAGSNLRNQPGIYGTKGVSGSSNFPGSRMESTTWVDTAGNFWLFGGYGYGVITGDGYLNDLWKRNPVNGRWTWVSGAFSLNAVSFYGIKGVASASNTPGARSNAVSWTDKDGNLWLFGGKGLTNSGFGFLNDVWKFDIVSSQWTWITGDTIPDKTGKYGLLGVSSATNSPGSRVGALGWNSNNEFYLIGGYGYDNSTYSALNDFWKFDATTTEWIWLGGSNTGNQAGSFGTKTIFSYSNTPPSRYYSVNWKDKNGIFWMFGGNSSFSYGASVVYGDLWKIDLCKAPAAPVNNTNNMSLTVCEGSPTVLAASGSGVITWYATPAGGAVLATGTTYTTAQLTGNTTYYVQDSTCDKSARTAITVSVNPAQPFTVNSGSICSGQSFTINATGAVSYTYSGGPIVSPITSTTYTIVGEGTNGCTRTETCSVTVNALPVISVPNSSVCSGESFTFAPTGANTYTYLSGSAIVTPTANTTYTISGTDINGCESNTLSVITVNQPPVLTINSGTICSGESFTLMPAGASTYTYPGGSNIVSPLINTSYSVTGTDSNGCISNEVVSLVSVNQLPTITVNSGSICAGDSFTIIPSGANIYLYPGGNNVVQPISNTTYTIIGTDLNGCQNIAISSITVNTLPLVMAITNNTLMCAGQTTTLTATGANTYVWNTNETTPDIVVSPTITTTYTVIGSDLNGCYNTFEITQNVDLCTGINERIIAGEVKIYPNPNNGLFIIELVADTEVTITNLLGETLYTGKLTSGKTPFSIKEQSGIYFMKTESENNQQTFKIIKQ